MTGGDALDNIEPYKSNPTLLNKFLHDPDITNLHTHGLHVSPDGKMCVCVCVAKI